jgi:hypothetical protein
VITAGLCKEYQIHVTDYIKSKGTVQGVFKYAQKFIKITAGTGHGT